MAWIWMYHKLQRSKKKQNLAVEEEPFFPEEYGVRASGSGFYDILCCYIKIITKS